MDKDNEKVQFVEEILSTREAYHAIITKYSFTDSEKDILLQATANIMHLNIDKLLIYEAYEILVSKIQDDSLDIKIESCEKVSPSNQNIKIKTYKKKEKIKYVPFWKQDGIILLLIGVAIVVSIFLTYTNNQEENERISQGKTIEKTKAETRHYKEGSVHGAWAYMQIFVEKQLKSPKSADFPFGGGTYHTKDLGNGRYEVNSYVDSNNAFGAEIRTNFKGVIKRKDGGWVLEYLNFGNN